ncbi:MAG: FMN-binding protein [Clostridia bacterium]|nr:FMN-binding protein [Clostridia bacterium]
MKKHIKSVISLTAICAVVSILMAVVNSVTAPIIKKQEDAAANQALTIVLPNGEGFEKMDISSFTLPDTVTEVYSEKNGGYVFKLTTAGYAPGFVIMCGVDAEGNVAGTTCIASGETLGEEGKYGEKLVGAKLDSIDGVDTVAGATRTTLAYRNAVKDALNAKIILGGGSVDLRTEEEILADNLSGALPAAEGKFTKVFIVEVIDESISKVYSADNKSGFVFVVGDAFIATDAEGNVTSEAAEDVKTKVTNAAEKIINSTVEEVDISGYEDMPAQVRKAYKTDSGNYLFELRAAGYGINGDYHTSGEYIYLRVSATAEGKIIDCETTSQSETDGIGSVCAEESFYGQFDGKDESTYKDIDAISGATITTNGYKTAVSKVFAAIKLLEGDAR